MDLPVVVRRASALVVRHADLRRALAGAVGRREQATELLTETVDRAQGSLGPEHSDTVLFAETLSEWEAERP